jgi:hypothetical protein
LVEVRGEGEREVAADEVEEAGREDNGVAVSSLWPSLEEAVVVVAVMESLSDGRTRAEEPAELVAGPSLSLFPSSLSLWHLEHMPSVAGFPKNPQPLRHSVG